MAPSSLKRKLGVIAFDTRTKKKAPARRRRRTSSVAKVKREATAATIQNHASMQASPKLKPKVEYSPNGTAKCQGCKKKIQKEHKRFGIPEYSARYDKEIYRYYHVKCCPTRYKQMIPDAVQQLAKQKQLIKDKDRIVGERQDLYNRLKKLRLLFANRLEVPVFLVFNNDVLNELVVKMPATHEELLSIHGIGPTKLQSFGDPILSLIYQYGQQQLLAEASAAPTNNSQQQASTNRRMQREAKVKSESLQSRRTTSKKKTPLPAAAEVIAINADDDDDDDDDLQIGASLTCEQLVNLKFADAEKNGYVISVD